MHGPRIRDRIGTYAFRADSKTHALKSALPGLGDLSLEKHSNVVKTVFATMHDASSPEHDDKMSVEINKKHFIRPV